MIRSSPASVNSWPWLALSIFKVIIFCFIVVGRLRIARRHLAAPAVPGERIRSPLHRRSQSLSPSTRSGGYASARGPVSETLRVYRIWAAPVVLFLLRPSFLDLYSLPLLLHSMCSY